MIKKAYNIGFIIAIFFYISAIACSKYDIQNLYYKYINFYYKIDKFNGIITYIYKTANKSTIVKDEIDYNKNDKTTIKRYINNNWFLTINIKNNTLFIIGEKFTKTMEDNYENRIRIGIPFDLGINPYMVFDTDLSKSSIVKLNDNELNITYANKDKNMIISAHLVANNNKFIKANFKNNENIVYSIEFDNYKKLGNYYFPYNYKKVYYSDNGNIVNVVEVEYKINEFLIHK